MIRPVPHHSLLITLIAIDCESSESMGKHDSSSFVFRLSLAGSSFLDIFMDLGWLAWGLWVRFQSFFRVLGIRVEFWDHLVWEKSEIE